MEILTVLILVVVCNVQTVVGLKSDDVSDILRSGVENKVYPGVAAISGSISGKYLYSGSFGNYEYLSNNADSPPVDLQSSVFDLASLSKVIATTSAVALLYQHGYLSVDDKISQHLGDADYSQNGKENVTVLNCLLHNAGYLPDPVPGYYDLDFGCPNTASYSPAEDFSCMPSVFTSLLAESLATPPGAAYVYSDLSFITLQFVVGAIALKHELVSANDLRSDCAHYVGGVRGLEADPGTLYNCYFEAYVRVHVFQEAAQWLPDTEYLPPNNKAARCLPTTNDTSYRHTVNQGTTPLCAAISFSLKLLIQVACLTRTAMRWAGSAATRASSARPRTWRSC